MENLLLLSAVTLGIIVLIGFLNEKMFHLNYEISLMLFSVLIGIILTVSVSAIREESVKEFLQKVQVFDLEAFLMKGVLCFMLFAGSCHLTISQFRQNARPIGVLAFVCTLLGAVFYGLLFFAVASVFHLPFTLPVCLMFGSIIAPTDPIAAKEDRLSDGRGILAERRGGCCSVCRVLGNRHSAEKRRFP